MAPKTKKQKNKEYSLAKEIEDSLPCMVICKELSSHKFVNLELGKEYRCVDTYEYCGKIYLAIELDYHGKIKERGGVFF